MGALVHRPAPPGDQWMGSVIADRQIRPRLRQSSIGLTWYCRQLTMSRVRNRRRSQSQRQQARMPSDEKAAPRYSIVRLLGSWVPRTDPTATGYEIQGRPDEGRGTDRRSRGAGDGWINRYAAAPDDQPAPRKVALPTAGHARCHIAGRAAGDFPMPGVASIRPSTCIITISRHPRLPQPA
jgi:hypothetical protein